MTTGQLLKSLRNKKGLTQEEVAQRLKITHNTYVRYENDNRQPNLEATSKLCEFYGITSTELLTGDISNRESKIPSDEEIKFALFKGENGITEEDFEDVKKYVEFVIDRRRRINGTK